MWVLVKRRLVVMAALAASLSVLVGACRRRQRVERLWSRAQGDAATDDAGVRDGRR